MDQYVDSNGVNIFVDVVGSGPPIVLHTGAGGDGRMWKQAGYLVGLQGLTCIMLDHRGHGYSDKPRGLASHQMERYVDDVVAVLDKLRMDRAAFWGYSAGSAVGYALAASHPDRITSLIATGAIGPRDYDDPREAADREAGAREVRQHGLGPLIKRMGRGESIEIPSWFWIQMTDTDREMVALELLGMTRWHGPWSVLPAIEVPVLLMAGELEDPDHDNARAAPVLPHGRSVTFPGLGHIGAFVRSELALAEVVPFLREPTRADLNGRVRGAVG